MDSTAWMINRIDETDGASHDPSGAQALTAPFVRAHRVAAGRPVPVWTHRSAEVVLTQGQPQHRDAVAGMHQRCSSRSLTCRYHAVTKQLSQHWLARLTAPEVGFCLLAWHGPDVVGMAQLLPVPQAETAELGILTEDAWQQRGVGTALLSTLMGLAPIIGVHTVHAQCLPGQNAVLRTAERAGLERIEHIDNETLRLQLKHPA